MTQLTAAKINPWALPSVPLVMRMNLPDSPGLYFAIFQGQILYVGKAKNIRKRWQAHHRIGDLQSVQGVVLAWLVFDGSPSELHSIEKDFINIYHPVLNNGPVFHPATRNNPARRSPGPKPWERKQVMGVGTSIYLDRCTINDIGDAHEYLAPIGRGAWFPEWVVSLMIGPDPDNFESDSDRWAGKNQEKRHWIFWVLGVKGIAESNGLPIEEALNRIADGTLKP